MEDAVKRLLPEITKRMEPGKPLIVAIDGRCGAGKTTLASQLQKILHCSVVHMDDFFLRPEQRTVQRYTEPGGNVDHERFLREVLEPISQGKRAVYAPFDCRTQKQKTPVTLMPADVTIVEGSYSCHPNLFRFYGLRIFLTVPPEEQIRRIRERSGEIKLEQFQAKWIPLEERYFSAFQIAKKCDLIMEVG